MFKGYVLTTKTNRLHPGTVLDKPCWPCPHEKFPKREHSCGRLLGQPSLISVLVNVNSHLMMMAFEDSCD